MSTAPVTDLPPSASPTDERNALVLQWHRWFHKLARRFCAWLEAADARPACLDAEDLAHEFVCVALRRFPWWDPERVSFSRWVAGLARSHLAAVRREAVRARAASIEGSELAIGDPHQLEPWALAVLKEEPAGEPADDLPPVLRRHAGRLADVYRAVRDTTGAGELRTCDIAERLDVSRATASRACAELNRLCLVRQDRGGRWRTVGRRRPARRGPRSG